MLSVVFAAPALADKPFVDTFTDIFTDENPCSGEDHEITINYVAKIHLHGHNFVLTSKKTGSTDSGFVMEHGTEHIVDSEVVEGTGIFHAGFTDVWRNDFTGEAFIVKGNFVFDANTDTPRVDTFSIRCLGS